jgi:PAT family beta-lactamase induction signal transducer AmpG
METRKAYRYTLFALLYLVQGGIMGYFTAMNAIYLLSFDLNMSQIGLMGGIAMIPFVLKIFIGVLSDRVSLLKLGHRKPYIILGLFMQAICLALASVINPGAQFSLFALVAFLMMAGMAFYDTCADGLALDTTPEAEQGAIQGLMVGGRALGVVLISAVFGVVVDHFSWPAAFWMLAGFTLLPLPLALMIRETSKPLEQKFQWGAFRSLLKPNVLALAVLGAVYSFIIYGANQLVNPFLQESFGILPVTAGLVTMVWGVGVAVGGLTGGKLTDRIGHARAVIGAMVASMIGVAALAFIASPAIAWPIVVVFGLAFGFYETVIFAMSMELTDPRIAASMFSILMAVANIGTGIGFAASGALADLIDYRLTFAIFAALNVIALPLVRVIFRKPIPAPAASL